LGFSEYFLTAFMKVPVTVIGTLKKKFSIIVTITCDMMLKKLQRLSTMADQ